MRTRKRPLLWGARPFTELEVDGLPGWRWAMGAWPWWTGGEKQVPGPVMGLSALTTHTHARTLAHMELARRLNFKNPKWEAGHMLSPVVSGLAAYG